MISNDYRPRIPPEDHYLFEGRVTGPYLEARYYVYSKDLVVQTIGQHMAATVSCGLGVHSKYLSPHLKNLQRYSPKVKPGPNISGHQGFVTLVFPLAPFLYDSNNLDIPQMLNFLFGDFFEEKEITRIKLEEVNFSEEALELFSGPLSGMEKVRESVGTQKTRRPHIAVVPQPPLGMDAQDYATLCGKIAEAGADHIVDSDILVNPPHCPILERAPLVISEIKKILGKIKGRSVLYSVNITCAPDRIVEMAEKVIEECGGREHLAFGVCVANTGLSTLRILSNYSRKVRIPIHAHVTGLPLMTKNPYYGSSYKAFNMIVRLLGADIVHIGSLTGRYLLVLEELLRPSIPYIGMPMVYQSPIPSENYTERATTISEEESIIQARDSADVLSKELFVSASGRNIRESFPVVTGGINPSNAEYHARVLGNNIILLAGAGLFMEEPSKANYLSIQSAIRAFRQTVDIIMNNENVGTVMADERRSSKHRDLAEYWSRHKTAFDEWDWRKQPISIKSLDRLRPATRPMR